MAIFVTDLTNKRVVKKQKEREIRGNDREEKKKVCRREMTSLLCGLEQGSPTPGPRTGTNPWPVRNRAAQQEVRGRQSFISRSPLLALLPEPSPPNSPARIHGKIVFHETGPWCQKGWGAAGLEIANRQHSC